MRMEVIYFNGLFVYYIGSIEIYIMELLNIYYRENLL